MRAAVRTQLVHIQFRAVGEQKKRELIASADKEVAITLATATEEAAARFGAPAKVPGLRTW